jgi:hypothetical protein
MKLALASDLYVDNYPDDQQIDWHVVRRWTGVDILVIGGNISGSPARTKREVLAAREGSEGPTVRNRTVRNRIFSQISPSTCARRWIGHQKLNSAAIMREIMAGMWDFPCFGPARAHLSRSKRAPIAGGHNAGNTGAGGGAAVAGRISGHSAVPTSSLTGSRFQSPC